MTRRFRLVTVIASTLLIVLGGIPTRESVAFFECGHHVIAVLAFEQLPESRQNELLEILSHHPHYETQFRVPAKVKNQAHWLFGRAGYWPDIARQYPEFDRPSWHYERGSTLSFGDVSPPDDPGPLPEDATLETQELYASQAFTLCVRVLNDEGRSKANRAVALCWILHIGANVHQPCHGGNLYVEQVFPNGDRGASWIKVKQGGNLRAFWDGLLGRRFNEEDVNRRLIEIDETINDRSHGIKTGGDNVFSSYGAARADKYADQLRVQKWIQESRTLAGHGAYAFVYSPTIYAKIIEVYRLRSQGVDAKLPVFDLATIADPEIHIEGDYLSTAGACARVRAHMAGKRLGEVLR